MPLIGLALLAGAGCGDDDTRSANAAIANTTTAPQKPAAQIAGWSPVDRPTNGSNAAVQWYRAANGQLASVALPARPQPFPVVVYYHGSSGLFPSEVAWTAELAKAGFAVVAGCWSPGASDTVQCPNITNPGAAVGGIYDFATKLPGVDTDRIAVMGVSSGAAPAALSSDTRVKAIVADSGLTPQPPNLVAPILVMSGAHDPRSTGVQAWAKQLHDAGETVESKLYPNGDHVVTTDPHTTRAATADVVEFLNRRLGSS
jgi:dienelactone hydrolase